MALINCSECNQQVSDKAAACPHCGAPVEKKSASQAAAPRPQPPQKKSSKASKIFWWAVAIVIGLPILATIIGGDKQPAAASKKVADAPKTRVFSKIDALTMCQLLIKRASRDPEKAEVPYIAGIEAGSEYVFSWDTSTKLARLRNGLGLEVGTTAYCSVNKETKQFTKLAIDGKGISLK